MGITTSPFSGVIQTAPAAPPAAPVLTIGDQSFNLIVVEEDGSSSYYQSHYQHFDWPAGASGATVGLGYDCGYVSASECRADWAGIIPDNMIDILVTACGITGRDAASFVAAHKSAVTISWDQAMNQFRNRELPKWIAITAKALQNCALLPPDCLGVLVSLTYNRGASYDLPGARYAEMRAIKALMSQKDFGAIPAQILSMRRLWLPASSDLYKRRGHEALLFRQALADAANH